MDLYSWPSLNPDWCYIPKYPYRFLIIVGSGSGKTNALLNLTNYQWPDIDKIYFYLKESFKSKYHWNKKSRNYKIKKFKGIDSSQTIDGVYENLEDYNPTKKRKVLILFDNMIADMDANTKLSPIVTELFLILFNIAFVFISQSLFER